MEAVATPSNPGDAKNKGAGTENATRRPWKETWQEKKGAKNFDGDWDGTPTRMGVRKVIMKSEVD